MASFSTSDTNDSKKQWLREASMKRLSLFMKNKTELINNKTKLIIDKNNIDPQRIESSGLSEMDVKLLQQWISGTLTGRQCMLAMLHERSEQPDSKKGVHQTQNVDETPNLAPVELVRSIVDLPSDFLCDSGYLYDSLFSRPPSSVVKEALQLIVQRALERNPSQLGAEQINIAIKQLRLDNMVRCHNQTGEENSEEGIAVAGSVSEEKFRLQVMVELIRMHIAHSVTSSDDIISSKKDTEEEENSLHDKENNSSRNNRSNPNSDYSSEEVKYSSFAENYRHADPGDESNHEISSGYSTEDSDSLDSDGDSDSLDELLSKYLPAGFEKRRLNKKQKKSNSNMKPKSTADNTDNPNNEKSETQPKYLDLFTIEEHLQTPLQTVLDSAKEESAEVLESTNNLLKPYLKRLSAMKGGLAAQLKELQASRAYLALGVTAGCSDEALKKAYRALAVRLHPDKPGGDTAKFQQLQDSYNEVIKKRKSSKAQREAMDEVVHGKEPCRKAAHSPTKKDMEREHCEEDDPVKTDDSIASDEMKLDTKADASQCTGYCNEISDDGQQVEENDEDSLDGDGLPDKVNAGTSDEDEAGDETIHASENNDDHSEKIDDLEGHSEEFAAFRDRLRRNKLEASDADDEKDSNNVHNNSSAEPIVEDVSDEEDNVNRVYERMFGNDSASNATTSPKAVHRVFESETAHVDYVETEIGGLLIQIQQQAGECTRLAQLNIKWQKAIDKACNQIGYPGALAEIIKIISASSGSRSLLKIPKSSKHDRKEITSNQEACSLQNAVAPVELVCELTQRVSALAMELPNECGMRYAAAAAGNKAFLEAVEKSMHLSLGALKTVLGLINTQEQLASCIKRVRDSLDIADESEEIHSLLVEMVRTGIKSNVITITNAVDKVVEAALAASDVQDQVSNLRNKVAEEVAAEVKRKAALYDMAEAEDDYCEEDREALRKCRQDMFNKKTNSQNDQGSSDQQEKQNNKDDEKNGSGDDADGVAAGMQSLTDLKDKIRMLQVQLKVQHVQALQTMNAEALNMQQQILEELHALPFVTDTASLFTAEVNKRMASSSGNSSLGCDNSKQNFKDSVLSLLAELVDNSCHAFRNELNNGQSHDQANTICLFEDHLHWLRIVLADGSNVRDILDDALNKLIEQRSSATSTHSKNVSDGNNNEKATKAVRLALLPDYRTKTLYLASLVDAAAVKEIIGTELLQRLGEILALGNSSYETNSAIGTGTDVEANTNQDIDRTEELEVQFNISDDSLQPLDNKGSATFSKDNETASEIDDLEIDLIDIEISEASNNDGSSEIVDID